VRLLETELEWPVCRGCVCENVTDGTSLLPSSSLNARKEQTHGLSKEELNGSSYETVGTVEGVEMETHVPSEGTERRKATAHS